MGWRCRDPGGTSDLACPLRSAADWGQGGGGWWNQLERSVAVSTTGRKKHSKPFDNTDLQDFLIMPPIQHFGKALYILCHCILLDYNLLIYNLLFSFVFAGVTTKRLR